MNYWMLKSEPDVFSISDLRRKKVAVWDGVRNYQARNYLLASKPGDLAFFYHSSTEVPGVVGLAKIVEVGVPDPTQFDPKSDYYDAKSTRAEPRWRTVKVAFEEAFAATCSLDALKSAFTAEELVVVRKGNRLSVMPVAALAAEKLLALARGASR
jgi:predicted RNA-binding protein with PUA-like domain